MWGLVGGPAGTLPVRQLHLPRPVLGAARIARTVTGTVLGRVRAGNRSEPLATGSGVTVDPFEQVVADKIATVANLIEAGEHEDGWCHGLRRIVLEAIDEQVDTAAWLRGRELYQVPEKVEARILRAIDHAREAHTELQFALRELR